MRVGVPKEIKTNEHRVGLTPTAVREYVAHGHEVRRAPASPPMRRRCSPGRT